MEKVEVYYTYLELKKIAGIPLFVKFLEANQKLICLELQENVSNDLEKLEKIEQILSNLFFIGLKKLEKYSQQE